MAAEKRNQMMQNLFGDQYEDDVDEEESDADEAESVIGGDTPPPSHSHSEEWEGEEEFEGVGQESEDHIESEEEPQEIEPDEDGSECEKAEKETSDLRVGSCGKRAGNEEEDDFDPKFAKSSGRKSLVIISEKVDGNHCAVNDGQDNDPGMGTPQSDEHGKNARGANSEREDVTASNLERYECNQYGKNKEEEAYESILRLSSRDHESKGQIGNKKPSVDYKDVFGDSDEEDPEECEDEDASNLESFRSSLEDEENDELGDKLADAVHDEHTQYESEEDNIDQKLKENLMGSPLVLEIPLRRPPGQPDKMNIIRVSNVMGIERKPFVPDTYVEDDGFVTDESGNKKRIRLEDNIVRWRTIQKQDGTISYDSNARFVRWSDGSLQLLIGNEVLDISVQKAEHDQTHLFLRHEKMILQSQGRLLKKMMFMPTSLSSKSHQRLTALVDSHNKKVYKVKNWITDVDPEKEKVKNEKADGQLIRANKLLHQRRQKISRKYSRTVDREHPLSPGFLEDAFDEDDGEDGYYAHHRRSRRRIEPDLEESRAEKRILNAERFKPPKRNRHKSVSSSGKTTHLPVDETAESERDEESEYESTGDEDERSNSDGRSNELEDGEYYPDEDFEGVDADEELDEDEEQSAGSKETKGKLKEIESDSSSSAEKQRSKRRRSIIYDSDDE